MQHEEEASQRSRDLQDAEEGTLELLFLRMEEKCHCCVMPGYKSPQCCHEAKPR
jgi:hypothetical protein